MKYYIEVVRRDLTPYQIEIQIKPSEELYAGYLSAIKRVNVETNEIEPAEVYVRGGFSSGSPHRIEKTGDWFKVSACVARQLDGLIRDEQDFERKLLVEQAGEHIILNFAE